MIPRWSKGDSNSRSHVLSKRDAGTIRCALSRWRSLVRGALPCPLRSRWDREFESPLLQGRVRCETDYRAGAYADATALFERLCAAIPGDADAIHLSGSARLDLLHGPSENVPFAPESN